MFPGALKRSATLDAVAPLPTRCMEPFIKPSHTGRTRFYHSRVASRRRGQCKREGDVCTGEGESNGRAKAKVMEEEDP